ETGSVVPARVLRRALADGKPGGHGDRAGAAAALELACWDLNAKLADEPAYRTLAGHFGRDTAAGAVPVYAAGGYYCPSHDSGGLERLRTEMRCYLDLGYQAVKMKIGGASMRDDLDRVETVIDVVGSGARVAVDA